MPLNNSLTISPNVLHFLPMKRREKVEPENDGNTLLFILPKMLTKPFSLFVFELYLFSVRSTK